jgi:voltage-gated potassium channel
MVVAPAYLARGLLRALGATTALIALYFLGPIDHIQGVPVGVSLAVGLLVLVGVTIWQIRAITRATYPGVRAIEALATAVPLFLLLFAASYFLLERADPANFSTHALTRADAVYFTVTIFATVGFGDISATSRTARLLVSAQTILDLLVLGLGSECSSVPLNEGGNARHRIRTRPRQTAPSRLGQGAEADPRPVALHRPAAVTHRTCRRVAIRWQRRGPLRCHKDRP